MLHIKLKQRNIAFPKNSNSYFSRAICLFARAEKIALPPFQTPRYVFSD